MPSTDSFFVTVLVSFSLSLLLSLLLLSLLLLLAPKLFWCKQIGLEGRFMDETIHPGSRAVHR